MALVGSECWWHVCTCSLHACRYGPDLYAITTLGVHINVCLAVMAAISASPRSAATLAADPRVSDVLQTVLKPALEFYLHHVSRIVRFIG